jgi:hypothetical protein
MNSEELIEKVKLAIKPIFQNWSLFSNGTYIIVEEEKDIRNIKEYSLHQISNYGPVYVGGPAGDFSVIALTKVEGWSISGHGYGIYTYVHPDEITDSEVDDITIGLFGRQKRQKDSDEKNIIYINKKL